VCNTVVPAELEPIVKVSVVVPAVRAETSIINALCSAAAVTLPVVELVST
jgi:hypothetical protein